MSMLSRRLYSSCSRSAPISEASKSHTPTRGRLRLKPRVTPSQTLSKLTRPRERESGVLLHNIRSLQGKGRKGRRSWASPREMTSAGEGKTMNVPFIAGHSIEGFTPVHLYPVQAALHLSFTPPHLPLPINLGARMYTTAPSAESSPFNTDTLFKAPPRPSPVPELSRKSDNALGDHQSVLSALSHPFNIHHLGQTSSSTLPNLRSELEGDTVLARMIAEAGVKWSLTPELEWEKTLARLSSPPTSSSVSSPDVESRTEVQPQDTIEASAQASKASVNDAVTGLEALLDKLNMSQVDMTSVKRKRKQKISKHKYKKRRKVSRVSTWGLLNRINFWSGITGPSCSHLDEMGLMNRLSELKGRDSASRRVDIGRGRGKPIPQACRPPVVVCTDTIPSIIALFSPAFIFIGLTTRT